MANRTETEDSRYPEPDQPTGKGAKVKNDERRPDGLPLWAILVSGGVVLGLLAFNVLAYGPDDYPTTVVLGGLFGAIFGVNEYLKNKGGGK